jgi:fido (protein-threonine AMPylation protein)
MGNHHLVHSSFRRLSHDISGHLTLAEVGSAIDELDAREVGPYLLPGTNVLNHLRGLTDPEHAERFEARRINQRIAELSDDALSGEFDLAHLKAIQRYIFQDVYEWAEQFRTVNIFQGWPSFRAC